MAIEYSLETVHQLAEIFRRAAVLRPMRVGRYEPGTELNYTVKTVAPAG
ncbi:unnamed protein product, partial [marine sediment metagenome]